MFIYAFKSVVFQINNVDIDDDDYYYCNYYYYYYDDDDAYDDELDYESEPPTTSTTLSIILEPRESTQGKVTKCYHQKNCCHDYRYCINIYNIV